MPAALGRAVRTYARQELLELLTRLRLQASFSWKEMAAAIDYTGRTLYGQVGDLLGYVTYGAVASGVLQGPCCMLPFLGWLQP